MQIAAKAIRADTAASQANPILRNAIQKPFLGGDLIMEIVHDFPTVFNSYIHYNTIKLRKFLDRIDKILVLPCLCENA